MIPLAADQEAGTVECIVIARDRPTVHNLQHHLLTMFDRDYNGIS
ncbi:hypothetical protein HAP48_0006055 [Bradyrhizobium septentrionale]|nr:MULTISPECIES: hypothetical protein [Bradyrhizobium]MCK7667173.1 hypothetical protein [Bradyrhizobium sp. 2S1]UGY17019.1 hypothetical protein HAP48_0006055 [Bradyrhizobium septentrionale]UGY25771.1 hypothetical protein HU675_0002835 [Bradyrhizobium septentrionale]